MSTIVVMTDDFGDYKDGHVYRVRTRNAEEMKDAEVADPIIDGPAPRDVDEVQAIDGVSQDAEEVEEGK